MTTATPIKRNGREQGQPPPTPTPSLERQAMRFLLGHRLGRLLTLDAETGEPLVSAVHYVLDDDGSLVTHLPADSAHAAAIRRGGRSMLSVDARHAYVPAELRDADGLPTPQAVRQVQVNVATRLIEGAEAVARVLQRQITSVLHRIGQESETDAVTRATQTALEQMVVVRLAIEGIQVRLHADAEVEVA